MTLPGEPFDPHEATRRIREIVRTGSVRLGSHVRERMIEHDLVEPDILNVLRGGGITEPAELERGHARAIESWRYRVHTQRICVVAAFRTEDAVLVVTAWRLKRRGER